RCSTPAGVFSVTREPPYAEPHVRWCGREPEDSGSLPDPCAARAGASAEASVRDAASVQCTDNVAPATPPPLGRRRRIHHRMNSHDPAAKLGDATASVHAIEEARA